MDFEIFFEICRTFVFFQDFLDFEDFKYFLLEFLDFSEYFWIFRIFGLFLGFFKFTLFRGESIIDFVRQLRHSDASGWVGQDLWRKKYISKHWFYRFYRCHRYRMTWGSGSRSLRQNDATGEQNRLFIKKTLRAGWLFNFS